MLNKDLGFIYILLYCIVEHLLNKDLGFIYIYIYIYIYTHTHTHTKKLNQWHTFQLLVKLKDMYTIHAYVWDIYTLTHAHKWILSSQKEFYLKWINPST